MSKQVKAPSTPLVEAAVSLEEELKRFESLVSEACRLPLTSQKNIEKTAAKLGELGTIDQLLGPRIQGLMAAISGVGERQQANAQALQVRAAELKTRSEELHQLLGAHATLGQNAAELNTLVQQVSSLGREGEPPSEEMVAGLERFLVKAGELIESATRLVQDANEKSFEDLARQADSLRQQLLSARNKISLLVERSKPSAPLPH
jgi:hypothetical protein